VWLYGSRPKSMTMGLGCGLGCTLAVSVTTAAIIGYINDANPCL